MKAKETAVVLIEFQNEFCKEGGKLHDGVKVIKCRELSKLWQMAMPCVKGPGALRLLTS
jgi:nicotinamidase-related amidase